MLRVAYGFCLAGTVLGLTSAAAQAAGIGTVTDVVNEAFHTPPGGSELPAKVDDALVADETLRTGDESTIAVRFIDGSELNIEAGSEVVLSDYVYDTQTATSSGAIELNNGLFHFNSNNVPDSGIALVTPVATIGIRGTEFLVTVAKDVTVVDILDGEVEVAPRKKGGQAARCVGGQSALVTADDPNAICGDFGSFSTAAGVPPAPITTAAGEARERSTPDIDNTPPSKGPTGGPSNPPGKPSDPPGEPSNHSGHGDGTNPGKGHGNGNGNHGGNNGGADNPGNGNR